MRFCNHHHKCQKVVYASVEKHLPQLCIGKFSVKCKQWCLEWWSKKALDDRMEEKIVILQDSWKRLVPRRMKSEFITVTHRRNNSKSKEIVHVLKSVTNTLFLIHRVGYADRLFVEKTSGKLDWPGTFCKNALISRSFY